MATALALVAPAGALSAPSGPSTMTGEELLGTPVITSASCSPTGPSSFTYAAAGLASGPYPGFFFETGTVTTPFAGLEAPVSSFDATFVISPLAEDAGFRRILGRKTVEDLPASFASCDAAFRGTRRFTLFVTHRYEAQITTDERTCTDRGVGSIQLEVFENAEGEVFHRFFREDFLSDFTFTTMQALCPAGEDEEEED